MQLRASQAAQAEAAGAARLPRPDGRWPAPAIAVALAGGVLAVLIGTGRTGWAPWWLIWLTC